MARSEGLQLLTLSLSSFQPAEIFAAQGIFSQGKSHSGLLLPGRVPSTREWMPETLLSILGSTEQPYVGKIYLNTTNANCTGAESHARLLD